MTQSPSEKFVIRSFTSEQWDGRSNPGPVHILKRFSRKRLLVGLVVFVILLGLGTFGAVILTLGVLGIVFKWLVSGDKPSQKFVNELMEDVNDALIELTGDPNVSLSAKDLRGLHNSGRHVPLPVNGVAGLELRVGSERLAAEVRTTRVTVVATAPDYGTASFDRLLQATLDAD
ncbi:hypothetical protein ACVWYS_002853 [Arthrobacter sp. TE12231]